MTIFDTTSIKMSGITKTSSIANIIAKLVNKPKIIVGIKLEKQRVKKPKDIANEVIKTAFPTVKCEFSIAIKKFEFFILFNLYL